MSTTSRIIGPHEKYTTWGVDGVEFDKRQLTNGTIESLIALDASVPFGLNLDDIDLKEIVTNLEKVRDHYTTLYRETNSRANKQYNNHTKYAKLKARSREYKDIVERCKGCLKDVKSVIVKDTASHKYISSIKGKISTVQYAEDVLRILPGESSLSIATRKLVVNGENVDISTDQLTKIRLALINSRIVNWKWMEYQAHDGTCANATPYFLNTLGKFFYEKRFNRSPDSIAKSLYGMMSIQNCAFSTMHLELLEEFYTNSGHDVKIGQYPFDLIVDDKHAFLLTEFHESSVGIEMRISQAMFDCEKKGTTLYLPMMNPAHSRRIQSIVAGILFEGRIDMYTYVTYLESQICSDVRASNWSYVRTRTDHKTISPLPDNVLPFPKLGIKCNDHVENEMVCVDVDEDDVKFNDATPSNYSYAKMNTTFKMPTQYINGLKDYQIHEGVHVTVGVGHIGDLWRQMSVGADVLVTGTCRPIIRDGIKLSDLPDNKKYPKLLIVNDVKNSKVHDNIIRIFESHGTHVKRLSHNHGKAVLNQYKLLIHSMTTTAYVGNNRESYCLIDYSSHVQRDFIRMSLVQMFNAYGDANMGDFISIWKSISHYFGEDLVIFGHFGADGYNDPRARRKATKTINWVYYKEIVKFGTKEPLIVYTSHMDMRKIAKCCKELRIQATSRYVNHLCNSTVKGRVIKERMWHPRIAFNSHIVGVGSWDFAAIVDQKELQVLIYLN
jgi:hypothetical protein